MTFRADSRARWVSPVWVGWLCALRRLIAVAALILGFVHGAQAHSLDEVEAMLQEDEKFYQAIDKPAPDFTLRTADDRIVRPADLRGKVVVLHFIYTSCPDVCPLHAEKVAEIQAMVNATPMKDMVLFVTITTDPSKDKPEVLRGYGAAHGLNPANWLFLTTTEGEPEDTTRKLAEAFGHKFSLTDDGYQMHGTVTHVIDKEGRWRANFHGLNFQPVNLVTFINALTNNVESPHLEQAEGWWAKLKSLF
ncbi:SCO family protein [Mesorhizobium sp. M7A.F.Ca.US.008.03.1.1]|uniref:SCO family protein n=1 Tax=Mesorhizobium sp. M7A.F.Ca.US.008.03.1.1 TaxID=2496742 RepID=UPI000FCB846F|nr:SCO family protein [Mesorhizobium sp. M7A.F.Ca.US.008.03.1.1]RUW60708.1 SCO family protein [Mesorhizobium sp. M7A.F.Ca.US.008.03.1.1]